MVTLLPEPESLRLEETDLRVSKEWIHVGKNTIVGNWEPEGNVQLALPIVKRTYSPPPSLPDPEDNILLLVSLPALMGLRASGCNRADIVSFDTGPGEFGGVRDDHGQIIGCRRLVTIGEFPADIYGSEGWDVVSWEAANRKP